MLRSLHQTTTRSFHTSRLTLKSPTPTASEYASKALEQSQKFAQVVGDTTGKLLQNAAPKANGVLTRVSKPVVYWAKVSGEVANQGKYVPEYVLMPVYLKEGMSPPTSVQ